MENLLFLGAVLIIKQFVVNCTFLDNLGLFSKTSGSTLSYQVEVCDDGVQEEEDVVPTEEVGDGSAPLGAGVHEHAGHVDRGGVQRVHQLKPI
jgi:hypothetical protein